MLQNSELQNSTNISIEELHDSTVGPSMACAKRCGNMYSASLYGGLASLISTIDPKQLNGKRISMCTYGSSSASFFSLKVIGDTSTMQKHMALHERLNAMNVVPLHTYIDALKVRYLSKLSQAKILSSAT